MTSTFEYKREGVKLESKVDRLQSKADQDLRLSQSWQRLPAQVQDLPSVGVKRSALQTQHPVVLCTTFSPWLTCRT